MLSGLYSVASALQTAQSNQELFSENLAHAATPGFRRQSLLFESVRQSADNAEDMAARHNVRSAGTYTSFDAGPFVRTGNPLDVALSGDAFFTLDGPNGPVYTRNGVFQLNDRGELQTKGGLRVRGQGGPLTLPNTVSNVIINQQGWVFADGVQVGQLQLASFPDTQALKRVGDTMFEGPQPQTPTPGQIRVEQGYRESSNVQVVTEMVNMMVGMRHYEAAQKAMQAISDAVSQNTRPQA